MSTGGTGLIVKLAVVSGTGLPCSSSGVAGTGLKFAIVPGLWVVWSSFPLPSKVIVHAIGRGTAETSVNRMTAPPLTGIVRTAEGSKRAESSPANPGSGSALFVSSQMAVLAVYLFPQRGAHARHIS